LAEEKERNHELFWGRTAGIAEDKTTHFVKETPPFKDDFGEGRGKEKRHQREKSMANSTVDRKVTGREHHKCKNHTNTTFTMLFFPLSLVLSVECLPVEDCKIQRNVGGN
jgi:hypothetical protein